jgi:hypothetical protein
MRRQQGDAAQVELARAHALQDLRPGPRGPRGRDAVVGDRLGEVQHVGAVAEHGGAALGQVELAGVHLAEVRE